MKVDKGDGVRGRYTVFVSLGEASQFHGKTFGPDVGLGTFEEVINCESFPICVVDVIDVWHGEDVLSQ